jgi:uracil-DNA glycosylase
MSTDEGEPIAIRAVVQRLESLQRAGVTHMPKRRAVAPASRPAVEAVGAIAAPPSVEAPIARQETAPTDKQAALDIIARDVVNCQRCSHLACTRKQTVFGVGNPNARLCFVGEAPGADEDEQGIPFVGRAGQLLTKIIEACTLSRDEVYILNVLKCRPPGNRTPEPEEIANCREYLDRQLEIIRPEFICCLGAVAARTVLDSTLSIGMLRGKFHSYRDIPVLCTYHPSYLLRNPAAKRDVWEDMKLLMQRMGIDVERKGEN